jgi:hypothetical protein
MAKDMQISRVTTHSTKISAVNCKQLSSNIIDPLFLWYLWVGSVKVEPPWAKYPNLSVRSFVTPKKLILGFYFVAKVWVLEEQMRAERSTDKVEDVTSVRMNGFEGTRESSARRS